MNCLRARELLDRYLDRELDSAQAADIARHFDACAECAAELAAHKKLGELMHQTRPADPTASTWRRVLKRLSPLFRRGRERPQRLSRFAAAAAVLLGIGLACWGASVWWASMDDAVLWAPQVVDLEPYMDRGQAGVSGQALSVAEITRQVDFKVCTAPELPNGYQLVECSLQCKKECKVVRYRYQRGDDELLLLQYKCCHPVQHGKRQVMKTRVNGKPAQIVQCGEKLTASWPANGTAVSIIGPRDMCELIQLMSFVDERFAQGH